MNITRIFIIFILLIPLAYSLNSSKLHTAFDKSIKNNQLDSALIGVKIIDVKNNKIIYSINSNKNFIPASNTKLVTAAAALLYLGKEFKYQTGLYYDKLQNGTINNLYIDFSGDPSFTTRNLQNLLQILQTKKITRINHIFFVNRFFKGRNTPVNESQSSTIFAYGAPSSIYSLNENAVTLKLYPQKKIFLIKQVAGEPIKFINSLTTADTKELKTCQFNGNNSNNILELSGCLPINNYSFKFAISAPEKMMRQTILKQLTKFRISTNNNVKYLQNLPKEAKLLNKHSSAKLPVLLKHMLVTSDNLYAQTIARTIGYYYFGVGSFVSGKNAILEILKNKFDLNTNKIQLEDGAGTSEDDLLSPDFIIDLLYKLALNKDFELFKNLLPIYGETGTLSNRKSASLKGKVFAKTGTQTTAIALSGYLYKNNTKYAFSILINGLKYTQRNQAFAFEKDLLENI